jgi:hypothetical protein
MHPRQGLGFLWSKLLCKKHLVNETLISKQNYKKHHIKIRKVVELCEQILKFRETITNICSSKKLMQATMFLG